jgi:hypothetical protein
MSKALVILNLLSSNRLKYLSIALNGSFNGIGREHVLPAAWTIPSGLIGPQKALKYPL